MTLLYLVKLKQMTNRQPKKKKKMLLETIRKMPPLTWFTIPGIFPEGFNATVVSFRHHFQ